MNKSLKSFSIKLLLAACVCVASVSCGNSDNPEYSVDPQPTPSDSESRSIELSEVEKGVAVQANKSAWRLLEECIGDNDENVSLSPMSASICFSMLANAANGDSRSQLLEALGFGGMDIADVNSLNHKLASEICGLDANVTLKLANSIWYDKGINPKSDFMADMYNSYCIESFIIDHAKFANDVNSWCNKHTEGLIPKVLPDGVDEDFALVNALYFKGLWSSSYKFDKKDTKKDDFKNADGTVTRPEFMHNLERYPYHQSEMWSAVQIPFGDGGFRYTVVLPNEGCTIEQCLQSISDFEPATAYFYHDRVDVRMPKFKIKQEIDLIDIFKRLGVVDIFDASRADLSNMTDTRMVIDLAKQSVSFDVNEDGAEAAAVTVVGGVATALPGTEPRVIPFVVDRPFIYMISERSTGAILFIGCIKHLK